MKSFLIRLIKIAAVLFALFIGVSLLVIKLSDPIKEHTGMILMGIAAILVFFKVARMFGFFQLSPEVEAKLEAEDKKFQKQENQEDIARQNRIREREWKMQNTNDSFEYKQLKEENQKDGKW